MGLKSDGLVHPKSTIYILLFSYLSYWKSGFALAMRLFAKGQHVRTEGPNGESINCPRSFSGGPKWCNSTRPKQVGTSRPRRCKMKAKSIGNPSFFLGGCIFFLSSTSRNEKKCAFGSPLWFRIQLEINCCLLLFGAERFIQQDCFMHFHAFSKKWISPISIQLGTP